MRLARDGTRVLAGVRREADGVALRDELGAARGELVPVIVDVANEGSIAAAAERVDALVGDDGLWALVNNAGISVPGPVEHVPLSGWRRQFEVNLFGMVETTRACLPLLRRGVRVHGLFAPRIMFVSSIGGRIAHPVNAPYTCSKFATNALGDALRLELRRQGIGVTVVEPGAISTPIWGKGHGAADEFGPGHPARAHYGPEIDGIVRLARQLEESALSADAAAEIMARKLSARRAPARVLIGRDAKLMALVARFLPASWFDALVLRAYGVARLPTETPSA